jgi:hypothetical protein
MGDAGIALSSAHVRAAALAAGALAVALACALLVLASRTSVLQDGEVRRATIWLTQREAPPRPQDRRAPQPYRATGAQSAHAAPDTRPAADRAALSQMLRCFGARRDAQRPADCPREAPPPQWSSRAELPVGGDYHQPPAVDLERVYSRAELNTIVMPTCRNAAPSALRATGCVPIGPTPPPPTRSAQQICEEGGLGGPCAPPPDLPADATP